MWTLPLSHIAASHSNWNGCRVKNRTSHLFPLIQSSFPFQVGRGWRIPRPIHSQVNCVWGNVTGSWSASIPCWNQSCDKLAIAKWTSRNQRSACYQSESQNAQCSRHKDVQVTAKQPRTLLSMGLFLVQLSKTFLHKVYKSFDTKEPKDNWRRTWTLAW